VPRPAFPRTIVEFHRTFATEDACVDYLARSRWPEGFRCPACGSAHVYLLRGRRLWQCQVCRRQTSVTAGTVLHRTRQPLSRWFHAAYLLGTMTPGVSALQLQRQLGSPSYGSTWSMLHRLRRAMQKPALDRLAGAVEVDETYVGAARRGGKRGRGAADKVLVAGAVEVRGRGSGRIRLAAIPEAAKSILGHFVRANVEPGSRVFTDGWRSYALLDELGYDHEPEKTADNRNPGGILPRIHRVFSNLKTWLAGTHHGVDAHYLPRYLREFEYRFNRRAKPMAAVQTLLGLAGTTAPERPHKP